MNILGKQKRQQNDINWRFLWDLPCQLWTNFVCLAFLSRGFNMYFHPNDLNLILPVETCSNFLWKKIKISAKDVVPASLSHTHKNIQFIDRGPNVSVRRHCYIFEVLAYYFPPFFIVATSSENMFEFKEEENIWFK